MLVQFSVTNYRNFKETATLDLSEAKITEHPQHLLKSPSDDLGILPVAAIYGPNGSGKTNLLKGLWQLRSLVLDPSAALENDCYFCFDSSCKEQPVEYDIIFRIADREYDYQLKTVNNIIAEENLFGRALTDASYDVLFDRDNEGVFLCKALENTNVSDLTEHLSLLYFLGIHNESQEIASVLGFFRNMIFFSESSSEPDLLTAVTANGDAKGKLLSHIQALGLNITDIRIVNGKVFLTHTPGDTQVTLPLESESAGTRQILHLLSTLLTARENGALILADHPEICLHPKTVEYLYKMAADSTTNPYGSQFLAATHENATMNNSVFRRDELWLVNPKEDGSSSLYTLALFLKENGEKVRKDETYFKQYLEGRYGALPR